MVLEMPRPGFYGMSEENFKYFNLLIMTYKSSLFTLDKPVIFAFHGYPSAVEQILFGRTAQQRFHIVSQLKSFRIIVESLAIWRKEQQLLHLICFQVIKSFHNS